MKTQTERQQLVDEFNEKYPTGTKAVYFPLRRKNKDIKRVLTRGKAAMLCGTPCVYVTGIGSVDIEHLVMNPSKTRLYSYYYAADFDHAWE